MDKYRRKSERIAVKESLLDVSKMEVSDVPLEKVIIPEEQAKIPKTEGMESQPKLHVSRMQKRANTIETRVKRKYVRKKPFVSKKAKNQARLEALQVQDAIDYTNAENSPEEALIEDKVTVDKKASDRTT